MGDKSSRLPGFYDLSVDERLGTVARWAGLDDATSTPCTVYNARWGAAAIF